jgi:hypothetical protein
VIPRERVLELYEQRDGRPSGSLVSQDTWSAR